MEFLGHPVSVQTYPSTPSRHFSLLTSCTPAVTGSAHCWVSTEVPKYRSTEAHFVVEYWYTVQTIRPIYLHCFQLSCTKTSRGSQTVVCIFQRFYLYRTNSFLKDILLDYLAVITGTGYSFVSNFDCKKMKHNASLN